MLVSFIIKGFRFYVDPWKLEPPFVHKSCILFTQAVSGDAGVIEFVLYSPLSPIGDISSFEG